MFVLTRKRYHFSKENVIYQRGCFCINTSYATRLLPFNTEPTRSHSLSNNTFTESTTRSSFFSVGFFSIPSSLPKFSYRERNFSRERKWTHTPCIWLWRHCSELQSSPYRRTTCTARRWQSYLSSRVGLSLKTIPMVVNDGAAVLRGGTVVVVVIGVVQVRCRMLRRLLVVLREMDWCMMKGFRLGCQGCKHSVKVLFGIFFGWWNVLCCWLIEFSYDLVIYWCLMV